VRFGTRYGRRPDEGLREETLWFEDAVIRYCIFDRYTIDWADGRKDDIPLPRQDLLPENLQFFGQYLRGERERSFFPGRRASGCGMIPLRHAGGMGVRSGPVRAGVLKLWG